MINLSEITVRGLLFAHWIMGTLESRFSTVAICILNKSASIRSAVYTIRPSHMAAILSLETTKALFYHAKPRRGNHEGEAWRGKTKLFRSPGTRWPPCDKGELSSMFPCYRFNSIPLETSTGYVLVYNDACRAGVLLSDVRFQLNSAIFIQKKKVLSAKGN